MKVESPGIFFFWPQRHHIKAALQQSTKVQISFSGFHTMVLLAINTLSFKSVIFFPGTIQFLQAHLTEDIRAK